MKKKLKLKRVVTYEREPDREGMFLSLLMACVVAFVEIVNINTPSIHGADHFISFMFGIVFFVFINIFFKCIGKQKQVHYEEVGK